jgi:PmbA protein
MRSLAELKSFAREAARLVAREKDLAAYEIYCSSSEQIVCRLNYTSDIPCRGVEEVKSLSAEGFALRIVARDDPHRNGLAFEAGEMSLDAVRLAIEKTRRTMVIDRNFTGLPSAPRRLAAKPARKNGLIRAGNAPLVTAAWAIIHGAIDAFAKKVAAQIERPGFILGGDVTLTRDRIAIANSNFNDIRADESAHFSSSVTTLVEALDAKGTATAIGASVDELRRLVPSLGTQAVSRALELGRGERPPGRSYRVLLGPQPVAEILNYMVMGSLTTGAFYAASSAYQGRFGDAVMDSRLDLIDDPALARGAVRRRITCEGLPAQRTDLIRAGRLVGLLSNFYDANRLASDENRAEKLGPAAGDVTSFPVRSGYRLGEGGGRRFDMAPAAAGTNVVMRARDGLDARELIRTVGDGIYVGRVWYTYPINGQRAGDFTCTISGDSWIIRNGELAAPLAPNSLRINAHIDEVFNAVIAAGRHSLPAIVWGSPEAYYVPAIIADKLTLNSVGVEQ